MRKGLRRPVAQRVNLAPGPLQFGQNLNRLLTRALDHFRPAVEEGAYQFSLPGMARDQFFSRLGERPAFVLPGVPFRRADFREESLHPFLVSLKHLSIKMARIPI